MFLLYASALQTFYPNLFMILTALLLLIIGLEPDYASEDAQNPGKSVQIRVAAGQFQLQPELSANLKAINKLLEQASEKKVELIVFPECALTGYPPKDCKSLDYIKQDQTEKALKQLQQRAKELSIAIAIGVGWKDEQNAWRNRAFLIDENGEILGYYNKIQQTGHERKFFKDGKRLPTFIWRNLRIGMLICMDMRYPELWRLLRKDGANLTLHLASAYGSAEWKVPVLEGTMRCRAAENGYYIVSCNNAGPIPMMVSGIYNPNGLILAKANYAVEELIFYDIEVGEPKGFVDFQDDVYKLERIANQ